MLKESTNVFHQPCIAQSVNSYPVGMIGAFGNLPGNGFHILTLAHLQVVLIKGVDSYFGR
jgi:hypothetical protein